VKHGHKWLVDDVKIYTPSIILRTEESNKNTETSGLLLKGEGREITTTRKSRINWYICSECERVEKSMTCVVEV